MIGVGIIGLGYWGPNLLRNVADLPGARLVCASDLRADRLDAAAARYPWMRTTRDAAGLIADPAIDAVAIATPVSTHFELAMAALGAGKHVLVEKPVSIRAADAERLSDAGLRARTNCMPAMCMRFWPGWSWLAERIRAGTFGAVKSAVFRRLGSRPGWSKGFYDDYSQSGGALFDLHVHDADFVRWSLGAPARVTAAGSLDHVSALYGYPKGPAHVAAEGGWDHASGFPWASTAPFSAW